MEGEREGGIKGGRESLNIPERPRGPDCLLQLSGTNRCPQDTFTLRERIGSVAADLFGVYDGHGKHGKACAEVIIIANGA
jgi:hypothetical protein